MRLILYVVIVANILLAVTIALIGYKIVAINKVMLDKQTSFFEQQTKELHNIYAQEGLILNSQKSFFDQQSTNLNNIYTQQKNFFNWYRSNAIVTYEEDN